MSSLNTKEQRWMPTNVQVTVLRGRGLRAKGKNGTSDVYSIIQLGKDKFSTCVVEKTTAPEWKEECSFEVLPGLLEPDGRDAVSSRDLVVTVMHRSLIGPDVFLGQALIPLDEVYREGICLRNHWYKLQSKAGKKEKERGEVQVTVQFTRSKLSASMCDLSVKDKSCDLSVKDKSCDLSVKDKSCDLSVKDKSRSAFDKLKDRVKPRKRSDAESASAVVSGGFLGLPVVRRRLPSDGGGEEDCEDDEGGEGRRSKMRNFFLKGQLRKSSDTRSSTSLGSESSESSSRGGSLSPTTGISVVVSDLSNSPSNSSNLTADNSPEHSIQPSPKFKTHKRAFSDETSHITTDTLQPHAVANLKCQSGSLSQSSLCVNGSHTYISEPLVPRTSSTTLGLLQKCSPLSRSLGNITRRSEDPQKGSPDKGRRWSFDKTVKEDKAVDKSALERAEKKEVSEGRPVQVATPIISSATETPGDGGESGKDGHRGSGASHKKAEQRQPLPAENKLKGWFGSKDSQNRPSPHPVKPLTSTANQEGRSVIASGLDKLRSTIQSGRSSQHLEFGADKNKEDADAAAPYLHLAQSELVSLLVQRDTELDRWAADFKRQAALLESRETELRKMKTLARDLEDYIDKLLVRIMEQKPTLLQVRSKYK